MSGDLMFGSEATYGTAATLSRAIEVSSESLDGQKKTITTSSTRWGGLGERRRNRSLITITGSGDVEASVSTKGMGLLWQAAFGGTSTSTLTATATVYQQVHKLANPLPSLTLQKLAPAVNADASFTDKAFTFPGAMVSKWEIDVAQSDVAKLKLSFATRTVVTNVAAGVPTYPSGEHVLHFAGACIFRDPLVKPTATVLASSANPIANVTSFQMSVDNSLPSDGREFFCANGLSAKPTGGVRKVSGTITAEFTSDGPFIDAFMTDATMGILVNLKAVEDANEVVQLVLPVVDFDGELPKLGDAHSIIKLSMKFTAWEDTAGDLLIGVVRTYDTAL